MSTILIVEDSAYQRAKLARLLKAEGHDLIETANAEDGLEALKSTKPDCIMLDLLMPGMGGLGFLKVYGERQGQAPIVVLTADIQETTREECMRLGARSFLNKPTKKGELLATLETILGSIQNLGVEE